MKTKQELECRIEQNKQDIDRLQEEKAKLQDELDYLNTPYKIGDWFTPIGKFDERRYYLLAQVDGSKVTLIDIDSGNRWHDPIKVVNVDHITPSEFDAIKTSGHFKKCDRPF